MVRIAGVNIPENKRIIIALTYIYGIGKSSSTKILKECGINPDKRAKDLTEEEAQKLRDAVSQYKVEGELRREVIFNIRRLKEIKSYRGIRHEKHLPVRGQKTRTNTRTVRGNVRMTVGSGRTPPAQKT